jgi:pimeloyl-ACP methyl ester carboxylesterase
MLLILFITSIQSGNAQLIFDYEQKIELTDDLSSQEINFVNSADGVELSGTIIYPNVGFNKVVIIVPGSGKDTRHSHFVLAKEFLANHIAVYRFDERGIGKSEGKYNYTASSLEKDVMAAFHHLRNSEFLLNKKIGILGHSLGGIASIGAYGKGCDFDFLIQMATPVENNGAFIKYQAVTNIDGFYSVEDKSTEQVIQFIDVLRKSVEPDQDFETIKNNSKALIKQFDFRKGKHIVNRLLIDLMKQNHEQTYQKSRVPILYIIGSNDRIVSSNNEILTLKALNNENITISLIQDVNHWLNEQIGPTKISKSLYNMTEVAMKEIINWTLNK